MVNLWRTEDLEFESVQRRLKGVTEADRKSFSCWQDSLMKTDGILFEIKCTCLSRCQEGSKLE